MLTQVTQKVKKVVTLLTEPTANFISLVDHASTQTPFKVVKRENVTKITNEKMDTTTPLDTAVIHKMEFDKAAFPTEESVSKHMDSHGYESSFSIEDTEKVFVIKGIDASAFDTIDEIPANEAGLTMFVGVVKSAKVSDIEVVEKAEGDDNVVEKPEGEAKVVEKSEGDDKVVEAVFKNDNFDSAEVVKKYAYWIAEGTTSLADELSQGNDGCVLGHYDVMDAFTNVTYNLIKRGEEDKIPAVCEELGKLMVSLARLASGGNELVMKTLLDKPESAAEVVEKSDSKSDEISEAVTKALLPLTQEVADLKDSIGERIQKSEDRIASVEQLKVTRKSAVNDEPATPTTTQKSDKPNLSRSLLGFR